MVGNKCDLIGEKKEEKEIHVKKIIDEEKEKDEEKKNDERRKVEENKEKNKNEEKEKFEKNENEIKKTENSKKIEENLEKDKNNSCCADIIKNESEINRLYFKEIIDKQNFTLTKDISGLNGFYLEDLLNETALLLYSLVKDIETATNDLYQIEGDSVIIENKLEIDNRQKSYHDLEYKKEINKINKPNNKNCCLLCGIF